MTTASTSSVYISVVEDVVDKVREEFVGDNGPGESVLVQLQAAWELKLMQAGVILGPIDRSSAQRTAPSGPTPVHDLNVPYEGTEEYETPTAELLFPPTPMQTPIQTPLPGTAENSMFNIPTGPSDYFDNELKSGRPSPYMQPPSPWMNQRPPLDVNVAYVDGARGDPGRGTSQRATQDFLTAAPGKRKRDDLPPQYHPSGYIPQQDGAGDAMPLNFELEIILGKSSRGSNAAKAASGEKMLANTKGSFSSIPQVDGPIPNSYDDSLSTPNIYNYQVNEDYNVVNTPAPNDLQAATPAPPPPQNIVEDDEDDEPLNENDDDDEDDLEDVDQSEELNTQHLVLAQFDKVGRTKSRWKCTLKDGIMHINSKDSLFNKANGEFDF